MKLQQLAAGETGLRGSLEVSPSKGKGSVWREAEAASQNEQGHPNRNCPLGPSPSFYFFPDSQLTFCLRVKPAFPNMPLASCGRELMRQPSLSHVCSWKPEQVAPRL